MMIVLLSNKKNKHRNAYATPSNTENKPSVAISGTIQCACVFAYNQKSAHLKMKEQEEQSLCKTNII